MNAVEQYVPKIYSKDFFIPKGDKKISRKRTENCILKMQKKIQKNEFDCEIEFIGTQWVAWDEDCGIIDVAFKNKIRYVWKFTINKENTFYVQAICWYTYLVKYMGFVDEIQINGKNYFVDGKTYHEKLLNKFVNGQTETIF